MYKTAIAHVEGELSYGEALQNFRASYPAYEIRGLKQSNEGWIAFIQKEAYQDQNVQDDIPAEMDESPGADFEMEIEELEEPNEESYAEEEEKQEDLLDEIESALEKVERLVSEMKDSEEDEDEVRPFGIGEEDEELEEYPMEMGMEKELPMTLEREKEAGVTFSKAAREIEQLVRTERKFRGYKVANVQEKKNKFVATLRKR